MHPGLINNEETLCEEDSDRVNLYGTGTVKGLEHELVDMYVEP